MSGLIGGISALAGDVSGAVQGAFADISGAANSVKSLFTKGASNAGAGDTSQGVQTDGTLTIFVQAAGKPNADWTGYTGWTRTRVTTGIETVPADFELEATENLPNDPDQVQVQAGDSCCIFIGGMCVLTGYIDRVGRELTAKDHTVRIMGRSKCADLVDCSAEFSTFQLNNTNAVSLAQVLTAPFNITAYALGTIQPVQIPQFDVILTETPYEIIERVCRFATLLAYDDPNGNLVIAYAGAGSMASGFTQGVNVQEAYGMFTMDERFSTVEATLLSTDTLYTAPGAPNNASALAAEVIQNSLVTDPGVSRYRPLIIVAEQGMDSPQVAVARCQWEVNRRIGRSQQVRIICDSWFDSAGALWTKNTLAPIELPALKITNQQWLIASATFLRDEQGTRADLTLMPAEAFQPEPILLQPYAADVNQAVNGVGGTLAPNGGAAASDTGGGQ